MRAPYASCSVRGMPSRAAWLAVVVVGVAGCYPYKYAYREPCDDASAEDCCPPGSHQVVSDNNPVFIICAADEMPCADAGPEAGPCQDAP